MQLAGWAWRTPVWWKEALSGLFTWVKGIFISSVILWDHVLSLKGCNVEWIYRKCSNALEFLVMDLTQWFSSVMWKRGNNRFSTLPSFCCYSTLTAAPMQEYKSMMQFSQWHNWTPDSFISTCLAFSFPLIARRAFLGACLVSLIKETTSDLIVRHSLQNHSIYCK